MTKVVFYEQDDKLKGFLIKDHSGYDEEGYDIVCASVSSAAYMAVNTVTEIIGAFGEATVDDGYLEFITESDKNEVQAVLKGLEFHVKALAEEYDEYILCKEKTV